MKLGGYSRLLCKLSQASHRLGRGEPARQDPDLGIIDSVFVVVLIFSPSHQSTDVYYHSDQVLGLLQSSLTHLITARSFETSGPTHLPRAIARRSIGRRRLEMPRPHPPPSDAIQRPTLYPTRHPPARQVSLSDPGARSKPRSTFHHSINYPLSHRSHSLMQQSMGQHLDT